mmetsp:Transcript_28628/g.53929  ORF Transcript_28628/g.53929 Transcript_28628/m.53929 type:complete len:512 (+) Transcript_28628:3696-5231(+)
MILAQYSDFKQEGVRQVTAIDCVRTRGPRQHIRPATARNHVITRASIDCVVARASNDGVIPAATVNRVVSAPRINQIITWSAVNQVITVASVDRAAKFAAINNVVTTTRKNGIGTAYAKNGFGQVRSGQVVVPSRSDLRSVENIRVRRITRQKQRHTLYFQNRQKLIHRGPVLRLFDGGELGCRSTHLQPVRCSFGKPFVCNVPRDCGILYTFGDQSINGGTKFRDQFKVRVGISRATIAVDIVVDNVGVGIDGDVQSLAREISGFYDGLFDFDDKTHHGLGSLTRWQRRREVTTHIVQKDPVIAMLRVSNGLGDDELPPFLVLEVSEKPKDIVASRPVLVKFRATCRAQVPGQPLRNFNVRVEGSVIKIARVVVIGNDPIRVPEIPVVIRYDHVDIGKNCAVFAVGTILDQAADLLGRELCAADNIVVFQSIPVDINIGGCQVACLKDQRVQCALGKIANDVLRRLSQGSNQINRRCHRIFTPQPTRYEGSLPPPAIASTKYALQGDFDV